MFDKLGISQPYEAEKPLAARTMGLGREAAQIKLSLVAEQAKILAACKLAADANECYIICRTIYLLRL